MTRIDASKVREEFSDTLNRVAYGRERILLRRRGKDVAALVPVEDLTLIEKIEDQVDLEEAEMVLAEMEAKGTPSLRWEKVKKDLGL